MILEKITSIKHPGAIFLKIRGTRSGFLIKVYPNNKSERIADTIIEAFKDVSADSITFPKRQRQNPQGVKSKHIEGT